MGEPHIGYTQPGGLNIIKAHVRQEVSMYICGRGCASMVGLDAESQSSQVTGYSWSIPTRRKRSPKSDLFDILQDRV